MIEPAMLAPVLSRPSLPLNDPAGLEIAPDDLAAVRDRLEREDLTVMTYRFSGDQVCGAQRFATPRRSATGSSRVCSPTVPPTATPPNSSRSTFQLPAAS